MTVTPENIAVELGRPAPDAGTDLFGQWSKWIGDARFLIRSRLGDLADLDQEALDYVVTLAVAAHVRRPDDATQVEVAVRLAATAAAVAAWRSSTSGGRCSTLT
jgi:hypothetical protein